MIPMTSAVNHRAADADSMVTAARMTADTMTTDVIPAATVAMKIAETTVMTTVMTTATMTAMTTVTTTATMTVTMIATAIVTTTAMTTATTVVMTTAGKEEPTVAGTKTITAGMIHAGQFRSHPMNRPIAVSPIFRLNRPDRQPFRSR